MTGGDSGIGAAIAVALAAGGTDVGLTFHSDRRGAEDTAAQVREQGRTAAVRHLDLANLPSAASVVDELADELGGLDVLVNCAGTGSAQKVMEMDFDTWRHVLSVDLDGKLCHRRVLRRGRRHASDGPAGEQPADRREMAHALTSDPAIPTRCGAAR